MESQKLLDTAKAADFLAVSIALLNKFRIQGGGPKYVKIGRSVRYSQAALAIWLTQNERESTSDAGELAAAR
jgi:predicted DNA-binding transcriptional regulator AlpA